MPTLKLFFIISMLFVSSCKSEEKNLIAFYNHLEKVISNGSAKDIYDLMDKASLKYVDYLTDGKNQDYEKLYAFGESVGYPFFTMLYYFQVSETLKSDTNNVNYFITFLRFNDIPLFSSFNETMLIEDKVEAGDESYLTVALEIGKREDNSKVYYSNRIKVVKEENDYKFNLLGMLKFAEKKLEQHYEKYRTSFGMEKIQGSKRSYIVKENVEVPEDMFKSFFENFDKPGNELEELKYHEK